METVGGDRHVQQCEGVVPRVFRYCFGEGKEEGCVCGGVLVVHLTFYFPFLIKGIEWQP